MGVITYGPSKMGFDEETDETYFTTELLVDGRNSGMFINRGLYPTLNRFIRDMKDPRTKSAYMKTTVGKMLSTALFEVDEYSLTEFIVKEISSAK